jgi:hypothetical protein
VVGHYLLGSNYSLDVKGKTNNNHKGVMSVETGLGERWMGCGTGVEEMGGKVMFCGLLRGLVKAPGAAQIQKEET